MSYPHFNNFPTDNVSSNAHYKAIPDPNPHLEPGELAKHSLYGHKRYYSVGKNDNYKPASKCFLVQRGSPLASAIADGADAQYALKGLRSNGSGLGG